MLSEYGYMEDKKLGKPYDLRLLKRLSHYALPYKKSIAAALFFTILITVFELAVPYLAKIAIDKYILPAWYGVDMNGLTDSEGFLDNYAHLLTKSEDGSSCYISRLDTKKIDPADLHVYKTGGVISSEKFYRSVHNKHVVAILTQAGQGINKMVDGSVLIPYEVINSLPAKDILKIRAGDFRGIGKIAALVLFLVVISFALSYYEFYLLEIIGQKIMHDIRLKLFNRIQGHAVRFFDHNPVGRLVTRVTNDIQNLNEMFKSVIITVFKDFFILTGILAVLLYLNWRLALVCFALIPFIFILTFLFSTLAREAFREVRASVAKINAFLQERISGMRVVQLFVTEKIQMNAFRKINHENYLAGMKQIRVFAVFMPIMELFSSFAVALIIWHGGGKVIGEQLTLGTLVAFITYMQMFFKPIRDISEKYNIMQSAMASTERIFEFMDYEEEIPECDSPLTPSYIAGHLIFDHVSFAYKKEHPVLHDISFEVRPGETVAIVGPTGSGKTTLVNLVERFYDPDKGTVFLDNIDLKKWPKRELRRNISLCMQDVFIFSGNLSDNISLGREDIDDKALALAAEKANALPFIQRLENGFEQDLSEGGSTLSTGERQLLSFARALAPDPKVLILDEATSSVDPETERLIQEAISRMAATRTTLVVAHRLSTIRDADRILVMHQGRIVERGTHEELISLEGIYSKLARLREEC
ncbi:MAG: ABC transporter ATP-binding protein [Desulfobacterales bacterium]|nr:ABC transporter ATP-binding protein [Desulfobacterales bacterium]